MEFAYYLVKYLHNLGRTLGALTIDSWTQRWKEDKKVFEPLGLSRDDDDVLLGILDSMT
jgi:hypothetical protein